MLMECPIRPLAKLLIVQSVLHFKKKLKTLKFMTLNKYTQIHNKLYLNVSTYFLDP